MDAPRQRICRAIGESGCYYLCLVFLAEKALGHRIDAVEAYERATATATGSGLTLCYVMGEDCYINDPGALMTLLCGGRWTVRKADAEMPAGAGELEILHWKNGALSHFVVGDGSGAVAWDPYGDSATVRDGYLSSKRLLRKA